MHHARGCGPACVVACRYVSCHEGLQGFTTHHEQLILLGEAQLGQLALLLSTNGLLGCPALQASGRHRTWLVHMPSCCKEKSCVFPLYCRKEALCDSCAAALLQLRRVATPPIQPTPRRMCATHASGTSTTSPATTHHSGGLSWASGNACLNAHGKAAATGCSGQDRGRAGDRKDHHFC